MNTNAFVSVLFFSWHPFTLLGDTQRGLCEICPMASVLHQTLGRGKPCLLSQCSPYHNVLWKWQKIYEATVWCRPPQWSSSFLIDGLTQVFPIFWELPHLIIRVVLSSSHPVFLIPYFLDLGARISRELKLFYCPGWCGSVDWALACEPKSHQFDSPSGHMPGLWARSPVRGAWEATTHWCFSPSFSPSLPLSKNK